jgi:hypothetical protein
MATLVDDIRNALEQGARAGAAAASGAGKDLRGDIEQFVIPHLQDIAIQVASIVQKRQSGIYSDETAKDLLDSEVDAIETIIETVQTLLVLEVQAILNAIMSALAKAVNAAVGVALI